MTTPMGYRRSGRRPSAEVQGMIETTNNRDNTILKAQRTTSSAAC